MDVLPPSRKKKISGPKILYHDEAIDYSWVPLVCLSSSPHFHFVSLLHDSHGACCTGCGRRPRRRQWPRRQKRRPAAEAFRFFYNSNYCCGPFLCVFIRDMEVFSHPTNLSELILEIFLSWDGRREYSLFFLFSFEKRDMQAT